MFSFRHNFTARSHNHSARNLLSVLLATVLCSLGTGLATAPAQATVVGVNPDITWGISQSEVVREVALIKAAGVTTVRASVDLSGAEYAGPGQLNMSYLNSIDYDIATARSAGLNVLLEFDRTPYWASADPNKYTDSSGGMHWNPYWKYSNPQDYANIVGELVNHFKGMGINDYEIWNEPNNPSFWPSGVNAAEYTELLKDSYPAVKAADPSATVLTGGLMDQGSTYQYLQEMYNAGARGSYDVASFHIYPGGDPTQCAHESNGRPSENSFCMLEGLHAEMTANGDSSPIWVTELGWSTCTQGYCVSPQQQASYMISAYKLLSTPKYSFVQSAFFYQMRDLYWETSNAGWESSLGMFNRDWTPKPSYAALQAIGTGQVTGTETETAPGTGSVPGSGSGSGPVTVPVSGVVEKASPPVSTPPAATPPVAKPPAASSPVTTPPPVATHKHNRHHGPKAVSASALSSTSASSAGLGYVAISLNVKKPHKSLHARSLLALGGVSGSRTGEIVLSLRHRVHGRWVSAGRRIVHLSRTGRYSTALRLARGSWRVSAVYGTAHSHGIAFRVR
ncbi:MAG TPA: cellulase family glycosylhydrolase [Solirubrobacteraceae bacterium]